MNTESFGFALLASLVGMAVVFAFLIVLSLMMYLIRRVFDAPAGGDAAPAEVGGAHATSGGRGRPGAPTTSAARGRPAASEAADVLSGGVPRWVTAAVLAYLATEEREYRPQSSNWARRRNR